VVRIEMQFMADITLTCEACKGRRFKDEILDARFAGRDVADVLSMTVDDALAFFREHAGGNTNCRRIVERLLPLQRTGLGYVQLGQSSSTLSGGEAQRIKLASFLGKGENEKPVLFIFDEPTTGLHTHDVARLLTAFELLLANGHSLIVIEHNPEVIKCADHVIDLGPEGGEAGGHVVYTGPPEGLVACASSHTGRFLRL
jgi:excinuclease ABC subunit A